MEGIAAYLDVNSASNGIQIINSYAAAEEFARRCLTHVIERVLVPHQPFMTEAECTAVIKDILRNCGISVAECRSERRERAYRVSL